MLACNSAHFVSLRAATICFTFKLDDILWDTFLHLRSDSLSLDPINILRLLDLLVSQVKSNRVLAATSLGMGGGMYVFEWLRCAHEEGYKHGFPGLGLAAMAESAHR